MDALRELMSLLTDGKVRDIEGMSIETMARIVEECYEYRYESQLRHHRQRATELKVELDDVRIALADATAMIDRIVEGQDV